MGGDEGGFGSPSRGSFPRRQTKELGQVQESPGAENQNPDFRTPNLCSRPSFRDKLGFRQRAGSLAGFGSKKRQNQSRIENQNLLRLQLAPTQILGFLTLFVLLFMTFLLIFPGDDGLAS